MILSFRSFNRLYPDDGRLHDGYSGLLRSFSAFLLLAVQITIGILLFVFNKFTLSTSLQDCIISTDRFLKRSKALNAVGIVISFKGHFSWGLRLSTYSWKMCRRSRCGWHSLSWRWCQTSKNGHGSWRKDYLPMIRTWCEEHPQNSNAWSLWRKQITDSVH